MATYNFVRHTQLYTTYIPQEHVHAHTRNVYDTHAHTHTNEQRRMPKTTARCLIRTDIRIMQIVVTYRSYIQIIHTCIHTYTFMRTHIQIMQTIHAYIQITQIIYKDNTYVYTYIYTNMCIQITHTHTDHTYIHISTYIHTYISQTQIIRTHRSCIETYVDKDHAHKHTRINSCIHTRIKIIQNIQVILAYINTQIHTHTHRWIQTHTN